MSVMHRSLFVIAAAALITGGASVSEGQVATGTVRIRTRDASDSAARARRERLLLRFDSLRYEFENSRMSDAERERLARTMHATVMALQESMDPASSASAFGAPRARSGGDREGMAIAMGSGGSVPMVWQGYTTRGYLGVSFDGPSVEEIRNSGERLIRFLDYPRIALVEPSSPAERAGIMQGDTLVAFNGNDVRDKEISLTRLLVPDRRVMVRVRRDGSPRDFRVTIEEAPGYVISRRMQMTPTPPAVAAMPALPPGAAPTPAPSAVRLYSGEELPRRASSAPMVAVGPTPSATSVWVMTDGVGGAKMETINDGLSRTIGVRSGVLVLRVGPGTPAFRSGLRDGDIILRASGRTVNSVRELRTIVENDDSDGVQLVIQRDKKRREVTLRW